MKSYILYLVVCLLIILVSLYDSLNDLRNEWRSAFYNKKIKEENIILREYISFLLIFNFSNNQWMIMLFNCMRVEDYIYN
jgi:hypothetical protein